MFSFTPACLFTWGLIYKSDLEYGRKPWIHNFQPAIYTPPKNTRRLASISSTIAAISSSKQFASLIRSVSDWKLICAGTVQRNEKSFYLILNMKFFHRSRVFFPPSLCFQWPLGLTASCKCYWLAYSKGSDSFFLSFFTDRNPCFVLFFQLFQTFWYKLVNFFTYIK